MLILAALFMCYSMNTECSSKLVFEHKGENALPWPKHLAKEGEPTL